MKSSFAIAAVAVAAIGLGAALPVVADAAITPAVPVPSAGASTPATPIPPPVPPEGAAPPAPATPPATAENDWHGFMHRFGGFGRHGFGPHGRMGPERLLAFACSERGAEALERVLDRADRRLDLSASQQTLFDTFRTKALTSATTFADSCKAAAPDRGKGRPDVVARLEAKLAIDRARVTALSGVLPDFEAFYTSLSAEQKARLGSGRHGPRGGFGHFGFGPFGFHFDWFGPGPRHPHAPSSENGDT